MKPIISPSILNADMENLPAECVSLQRSGADWIHCDVMDGVFVPNVSLAPGMVKNIDSSVHIPLDVHLMVENPCAVAEDYVRAGADIVTFHFEASDDVTATANLIRSCGAKVGVAVKPATPVDALVPYSQHFDMVLVMTVEPGFGGQKFIVETLEKIRRARQLFPDKHIQVDGGINAETAKLAVKAGADVLVAGSYIINSANRAEIIEKLKNV